MIRNLPGREKGEGTESSLSRKVRGELWDRASFSAPCTHVCSLSGAHMGTRSPVWNRKRGQIVRSWLYQISRLDLT